MKRWSLATVVALAVACASAPRPRVLDEASAARQGASVSEAKELAPRLHARAELFLKRAEAAHADGDVAGSQILAEQAMAAFTRAVVGARLVKAEKRLAQAEQDLLKSKQQLAGIDEKQSRVTAEAEDLEMRVKVAEDAIALAPNAPSTPERERARFDAARALTSQAELLCLAAQLIDADQAAAKSELEKAQQLDKTLSGTPKATPIDEAIRVRSACLSILSKARRKASRAAPQKGQVDALLDELSRSAELHPFRDDRGVVIAARGLVAGNGTLTAPGKELLALLGRVAKAHPAFPLLVVFHGAKPADAVSAALKQAGATRVETASAGSAQPLVPPGRAGASERNTRIEIIFVAPTH